MDTRSKIKRDLSRWSRKLLLCIGLEEIGKHLVGESKWHNLYPLWRDVEQERTADFDPSEVPEADIPDTASADLSNVDPSDTAAAEEVGEEKNETLENFIHSLPYLCLINRAFGAPGGLGIGFGEDLTGAANDAFDVNQRLNSLLFLEAIRQQYAQVPPALQNSFNHVQNSPLFSPEVFEVAKKNSYVSKDSKYNDALQLGLSGLSSNDHYKEEDHDEPLDLTQRKNTEPENLRKNPKISSKEVRKEDDGSSGRFLNTAADTPKTPNKVSPRPNQRAGKGYTSQELEAALSDIQSGKLGTRRAAVIYGIPRSTLRNKVYKLGKDRKNRPYFRQKNSTENLDEANASTRINLNARNHGVCSSMEIGDAGVVQPHNFATTTTTTNNNVANLGLSHTSFSSQTQRRAGLPFSSHPRLHQEPGISEDEVAKSEEEISHEKQLLKEWLRTKLSRQAFVEQHCKTRSPCDRFSSHSTSIGNNRALDDEEPLSDSSDNSDDVSRQDFRKEVILKIPLRNNKSSLSRVISRKKIKRRTPKEEESNHASTYPLPLMTVLGTESSNPAGRSQVESLREWKNPGLSEDGNDSMDDAESDAKSLPLSTGKGEKQNSWTSSYGRKELQASASAPSNIMDSASMAADANGKKSRPKRGKYRNYDREALTKAVRAVQNGEMSVHRAGSFYGVPHSTLEYKVKERHLLRRPKRKEAESPKLSHKSSPDSSMSGSDHQQQSRTASGTPSGTGANNNNNTNNNSTSLPLTPDLRESLSRYLNIGQSGENLSDRLSSSPGIGRPKEESLYSRENRIDNHSLGLGRRGIISPYLFNLDDLIRQNLETNSLLDLTKK